MFVVKHRANASSRGRAVSVAFALSACAGWAFSSSVG